MAAATALVVGIGCGSPEVVSDETSAAPGYRLHAWGRADSGSAADAPYEGQSAASKQAVIWAAIEASEYASYPKWQGTEAISLFLRAVDPFKARKHTAHMNVTMDRLSDVLPEGRDKPIHTYGSSVLISFEADDHSPYTGLYKGATHGLLRLSLAKKPTKQNSVPGLGVKFFIDGQPSANFVVMHGLDGQSSHDFFEKDFGNVLNSPKSTFINNALEALFALASKNPLRVSVAHLSKVDQRGKTIRASRAPEKLVFRPSEEVRRYLFDKDLHEVRDDFAKILEGTVLYEVWGGDIDTATGDLIYVGRIITTSRFIASSFGDRYLFFNHQRFDGL